MNVNIFKKFEQFDKVTEFRLKNAFIVALGMALLTPIIISLKGLYMLPWVISIFSIVQSLTVKLNKQIIEWFNLEQLYRIGILLHFLFICVSMLYFVSPVAMIYADSIVAILEVAIFSSYSIALNNYLTKFYPQHMSEFQIVRNSSWADGYLVGLTAITVITYMWGIVFGIYSFIAYNLVFTLWLMYHWNFFKDIDMNIEIQEA